jgi:hypothetical protein
MITVTVSSDTLKRARQKAEDMGKLNGSITKGEGNIAGFVGEEVVAGVLGITEWENTYDYDMTKDGMKIDIKTKRRNVPPLPHYDCQVPAQQMRQKCDVYVFVSVSYDNSKAWVLGYMPKNEFTTTAKFRAKGSFDGAFEVKNDLYYVPVSALHPMDELRPCGSP